jgi:hypothetical protein
MAENKSLIFGRLTRYIDPRLSGSLLGCIAFLSLITLSNIFATYDALVEQSMQTALFRLGAVVLYAGPAIGLFKVKRWGRYWALGLATTALLLGILTAVAISQFDGLFIIFTHGLVLWCLLTKKTRMIFSNQPAAQ